MIPEDWSVSVILSLFKKGDRRACSNYRGISLIVALLQRGFQGARDTRVRLSQSGFRPSRGCVDQIFSLCRTLEHRGCFQQPTVVCLIDFTAAFDPIDRQSLWKIMETDGFPPKLLRLVQAYYRSTKSRVRSRGGESALLEVNTGVRQGCPLSPTPFSSLSTGFYGTPCPKHRGCSSAQLAG